MKHAEYREIEGRSAEYILLLGTLAAILFVGVLAALHMEHNGHAVTGMDNQIVWGIPHVFAVFLIVCASGALNVASISSVFGKSLYKPLAPLSGLLALALLAGGLMVLVLDLGRPDRLVVAMTHFNFKSIFAWNIFLYTGFFAIVFFYLVTLMERRFNVHSRPVGMLAFVWRLLLTTGTGSIFGFLVAREAYDAAILAPTFIVMSFSFGLATFLLVILAAYSWTGRALGMRVLTRLRRLLGIFVAGVLFFVAVFHLTNLYAAHHNGVEMFILVNGGVITYLFWIGQVLLGGVLPLILLYAPSLSNSVKAMAYAAALVMIGGLAQVYVIIIGGQAYPLELFPGYEVTSAFFDGEIHRYSPSMPEFLLGIAGLALAGLAVAGGLRLMKFLPVSLADIDVDPHAMSRVEQSVRKIE